MNQKNIFLTFFLLLPAVVFPQHDSHPFSSRSYQWKHVGNEEISPGPADWENIAFSPAGELHLAFQDFSTTDNGRATVMKFNGTSWENVGDSNFTEGAAFYLSLAIGPSGEPYVAFMDFSHDEKATVMKFDGTDWVTVGSAGFSTGSAYNIDLAISPAGEPYLAYKDRIISGNEKATVMKFDGSSWVSVGQTGFTQGDVSSISLAFGPEGNPYVAFEDCAYNCEASVMKFNGTSWVYVGSPGFSSNYVWDVSLAFNQNGVPYVAFDDGGNLNKVSVMKLNGNSWGYVGTPGFSQGSSFYISLAFGKDGDPYVAFQEFINSRKATVMKFEGTEWEYFGDAGFSKGGAYYTSLAFDTSGVPFVAFSDDENERKATVMKYDSVYVGFNNLQKSKLSLFPNPVAKDLTVCLRDTEGADKSVEVYDLPGRLMVALRTPEDKIILNTADYRVGSYIIKIKTINSIYIGKFNKN